MTTKESSRTFLGNDMVLAAMTSTSKERRFSKTPPSPSPSPTSAAAVLVSVAVLAVLIPTVVEGVAMPLASPVPQKNYGSELPSAQLPGNWRPCQNQFLDPAAGIAEKERLCANNGTCLEMASSVLPSRDFQSSLPASWLAGLVQASAATANLGNAGGSSVGSVIRACLCPQGFSGSRCQDKGEMVVVDVDCGSTEILSANPNSGIKIDFAMLGILPWHPAPDTCQNRQQLKGQQQQQQQGSSGFSRPGGQPQRVNGSSPGLGSSQQRGPYSGPPCYSESTMALLRYWCQGKARCQVNFNSLTIMHDSPPYFCPPEAMDKLGFYYRQPAGSQNQPQVNSCQPGCAFHQPSRTCYCVTSKRGTWAEARSECLFKGGDAARHISDPKANFLGFVVDNLPLAPAAAPSSASSSSPGAGATVAFYLHPESVAGPEEARPTSVIKPDQPKSGLLVEVDLERFRSSQQMPYSDGSLGE